MKLSVKRNFAVAFGIFLLGAMAVMAQTQPTAIAVSPANPLIATTQTQQFTTLSTTPLIFGQARQIAAGYGRQRERSLLDHIPGIGDLALAKQHGAIVDVTVLCADGQDSQRLSSEQR